MEEHRISKIIARRTKLSRRDVEKLIFEKKIKVNNILIEHPSYKTTLDSNITIDNKTVPIVKPREVWLFYKPKGCLVTKSDPKGRTTIFDHLPKKLTYLKYIGRLDYNSEGLLLLTNDGEFARSMELPSSKIKRVYNCKVIGKIKKEKILKLKGSQNINEMVYHIDDINILEQKEKYYWVEITLTEGKNREVRNIFGSINLIVKRLVRIKYGKYVLGSLKEKEFIRISS